MEMNVSKDNVRVLIAITEASPVDALWRVALRRLGEGGRELTAVYLSEGHWHRAASLPFTREISRISGANAAFTEQRARQLHDDAVARAREIVSKLATDAKLTPAFEVLAESDLAKARRLLAGAGNLLIAPSLLSRRPFFAEFRKLGCRIELVGDGAGNGEERSESTGKAG
jgi:hypothetical protein